MFAVFAVFSDTSTWHGLSYMIQTIKFVLEKLLWQGN